MGYAQIKEYFMGICERESHKHTRGFLKKKNGRKGEKQRKTYGKSKKKISKKF